MLYMQPGSTVIEMPLEPQADRTFAYMSESLGMDYWLVPSVTSLYYGHYTMTKQKAAMVASVLREALTRRGLASLMTKQDEL